MKVTRSRNSGCCSRKRSNDGEAAQDVLGQVGAVDAQDQVVAPAAQQLLAPARATPSERGDVEQRLGVDRQRVVAHPHLAVLEVHDAGLEVDLEVHEVAAALQEVAPVGGGVEADDVVGQQAAVELLADLLGQHAPGVALRPRDVHEVVQEDVGARAAHERGQRVEVVVVDHHDRLVVALDLLDDGGGEVLVDDVVAVLERLDLVAPDVRGVGEVPEVVLDEPQHRVGEDVVEAVVGLGVADDQAHLVLAARRRAHAERLALGLVRLARVAVGQRRGDPHRVAVRRQARQGRHQPARPALDAAVVLEGHRARGWRPGRAGRESRAQVPTLLRAAP